ncbi:hypothetical protein BH23VER1_BH23VER1_06310 [soil metagenome]
MRPTPTQIALLAAAAALAAPMSWAAEGDADGTYLGLLPEDKKALPVESKERNPFAIMVKTEENEVVLEDTTQQEQRIRQFFASAPIGGVMRGASGYKVLIGGMILEAGALVPPVIPGQTEMLEVVSIDERKIEFAWVETEAIAPNFLARQMVIDLNVKPAVRTHLPGSAGRSGAPGEGGLRRFGDQQEELRHAMAVETDE